jgi:hydroxyacylglutathione hydrolase
MNCADASKLSFRQAMGQMRVVVVPVLSDNYSYLLIDDATKLAAAVDPAEASLVLAAARREGVQVVAVLTTHHHSDHAGGNPQMARQCPNLKVYGGRLDNVSAGTDQLDHGDSFSVGGVQVTALHTPGHTRGSMCYYCTTADTSPTNPGAVFTGDTMFVGGCGRIFESTPDDMFRSLTVVLGALPPETQVWVGHEYTVKNMEFAVHVEPEKNQALDQMLEHAKQAKLSRTYTVPSTLQNEWMINPYMRAMGDPKMASVCPGCTPVEVFTRLRKQKDTF